MSQYLSGMHTRAWCPVPGTVSVLFLLEPSYRRQGLGTEASLLIMSYGKTDRTDHMGRGGQSSAEPLGVVGETADDKPPTADWDQRLEE